MSLQEFQSRAEMLAHYAFLRKKFSELKPPEPKPKPELIATVPPGPVPPPKQHWFSPRIEEVTGYETLGQPHPSIIDIAAAAARYYNVTMMDLASARRTADVLRPRQVAMWLCRTMTPYSLPAIGRRFGDRDHTTVLSAVRKIEAKRQTDPDLQAVLDTLKAMLGG